MQTDKKDTFFDIYDYINLERVYHLYSLDKFLIIFKF